MKMFGLAAVAAVAAMAFVGATSASAADTRLCTIHDAGTPLTCDTPAGNVNVAMLGSGELLSDLVDVFCLHVDGTATGLALSNPQQVHVTTLSFDGCGTDGDHNNCEVSVLELPLSNLNKTGLDAGTLTGTNGRTLVLCENVFFGIDIHCVYDANGLTFVVGAQHLTANDTAVSFVEGGDLCPEESFLDGLLTTNVDPDSDGAGDPRFVLA